MYVPSHVNLTDTLKMPVIEQILDDTIPTIQMGTQNGPKTLQIDLSSIKDAPTPSDVTVKIKLQEGVILSYSVTVSHQADLPAGHDTAGAKTSSLYAIKKGDTATSLARKFNVSVSQIRQPLLIGKKLIIDAK